ncbi:MAG: enoyl-CoA hydratase/isomerase family protein [SAR86 cluster bacterium]|jgi:enoyl-CoA hydratase|tara:strand:- start:3262 stop:4008 length:747 start_codon:yes stop_codon:yes gene_type:complete
MSGTVGSESVGEFVKLLTIDNPPANAMDAAMLGKLLEEFQAIKDASSARAIILTGSGNSFCAGADLKAKGGEALSAFGRLLTAVESSPVPVIAAINGWCIGGGFELALCCDIRIASADARFVCAGVNMGLMASAYRLPRLIGIARAKAMLLTGSTFDALAVERFGVTTQTEPPAALLEAAKTLATRIASRAPLSVEATKRVASRAMDLDPTAMRELEKQELPSLRNSNDHQEAVKAFREKREPIFTRS